MSIQPIEGPQTGFAARRVLVLVLASLLALLALGGAAAQADTGQGIGTNEFFCNHVVFKYEGFPNAPGNQVTQLVTVNKQIVAQGTFTFNGPTGSNTVPIVLVPGKDSIDAHSTWKTNGIRGGYDHHTKLKCATSFAVQKLQKIDGQGGPYTTGELKGKVGQEVDYEIVVTNTGTVSLKFSNFTDPQCNEGTVSGGSGEEFVAPGESTTFFCERLLTGIEKVTNEATVTGTPELGPSVKESSNPVVTVVPPEAEFTIEKFQRVKETDGYTRLPLEGTTGTKIEYEILVTNTGNVPETYSEFSDPKCDAGTIAGGPAGQLLPGESTIYTCSHTMVVMDTRRGPYLNNASLKSTPPPGDGSPITHTSNTVEVTIIGGSGTNEFSCNSVKFIYSGFPNVEGNSVLQEIVVKGPGTPKTLISTTTFVFNGPSAVDIVPIGPLGPGKWIVDAHATWKTSFGGSGYDHYVKIICKEE